MSLQVQHAAPVDRQRYGCEHRLAAPPVTPDEPPRTPHQPVSKADISAEQQQQKQPQSPIPPDSEAATAAASAASSPLTTVKYLSPSCLVISYIGANTQQAVDSHFARALSQPSSFSPQRQGSLPGGNSNSNSSSTSNSSCINQHPGYNKLHHQPTAQDYSSALYQHYGHHAAGADYRSGHGSHHFQHSQQQQQPHQQQQQQSSTSWPSPYAPLAYNPLSHYYQPAAASQNPYPTYYPYSTLTAGCYPTRLDEWTSQAFRHIGGGGGGGGSGVSPDSMLSSYAYQQVEKKLSDDPWKTLYQHHHGNHQTALGATYAASPYAPRRDSLWLQ